MAKKTNGGKLAIDGGRKVWTKGFPAWPQFDRKTDGKILDILHSGKVNYWTGPAGMQFEAAWAAWLGVRNAVSVSNGAVALHVALTALGVGAGDEVICPSGSPVATSLSMAQAGIRPVVCDGDVASAVTKRTRAVVVEHRFGTVADMGPIMRIAKKHGLYVVEDCSLCVGGAYKGMKAGSVGTVGCFSFGPAGHFTTGGAGGMVCCNDDALAWEIRSVRDQGYDVRAKIDLLKTEGRQSYIHRRLGYNFRMTEIQSAIGLGELRRLDTWNLPRRRKLGLTLVKALAGHPLVKRAPVDTPERQNSFPCAAFVLDAAKLKGTVAEFVAAVQAEGVCADMPDDATIAFPTHPTYTIAHIRADVAAFRKVAEASKK